MKAHHVTSCLAAACLLIPVAPGCTSDSGHPANDSGSETDSPTISCPVKPPSDTAPIACDAPPTLGCYYVLAHCPGHDLGGFFDGYERAMYQCEGGIWQYKGQDCYDCCRGFPFDGGGDSMLPRDGGTDATFD